MPTEFTKIQFEQRALEEKLEKIAEDRHKKFKKSHPLQTQREALRNLGNRTIPKRKDDE